MTTTAPTSHTPTSHTPTDRIDGCPATIEWNEPTGSPRRIAGSRRHGHLHITLIDGDPWLCLTETGTGARYELAHLDSAVRSRNLIAVCLGGDPADQWACARADLRHFLDHTTRPADSRYDDPDAPTTTVTAADFAAAANDALDHVIDATDLDWHTTRTHRIGCHTPGHPVAIRELTTGTLDGRPVLWAIPAGLDDRYVLTYLDTATAADDLTAITFLTADWHAITEHRRRTA